jgi:hypothetical protein
MRRGAVADAFYDRTIGLSPEALMSQKGTVPFWDIRAREWIFATPPRCLAKKHQVDFATFSMATHALRGLDFVPRAQRRADRVHRIWLMETSDA